MRYLELSNSLRQKIEDNFPESGRRKELGTSYLMETSILVWDNGKVLEMHSDDGYTIM
jgi:hypothetical protein